MPRRRRSVRPAVGGSQGNEAASQTGLCQNTHQTRRATFLKSQAKSSEDPTRSPTRSPSTGQSSRHATVQSSHNKSSEQPTRSPSTGEDTTGTPDSMGEDTTGTPDSMGEDTTGTPDSMGEDTTGTPDSMGEDTTGTEGTTGTPDSMGEGGGTQDRSPDCIGKHDQSSDKIGIARVDPDQAEKHGGSPEKTPVHMKTRSTASSRAASRRHLFQCDICQEVFKSESAMDRHQFVHIDNKLYSCNLCGRQFKRPDVLLRHKRRHMDGKIRCYICEKEFDRIESLVEHMDSHFIRMVSHVTMTGYSYRSAAVVRSYRDLYRTDKTLPCYVCFTQCPDATALFDHLVSHTMLELLKGSSDTDLWQSSSSYTQEEYRQGRNRGVQKKVVGGKRASKDDALKGFTHVCSVCSLVFTGIEPLLLHWQEQKGRRGHEGRVGKEGTDLHCVSVHRRLARVIFTCEQCSEHEHTASSAAQHHLKHYPQAARDNSSQLADATTVDRGDHSGDQNNGLECPFSTCPICEEDFADDASYKDHLAVHKTETSCLCPLCGKLYARPEDLKRHIVRHVSTLYTTGTDSVKDARFKCTACSESFQDERALQFHGVVHGLFAVLDMSSSRKESTVCPVCGKVLLKAASLSGHIQLHSQEKVFKCSICSKAFRSERNKARHEKIHYGKKEFICEICGKGLSRKAEYLAHVNRHLVNPHFNGKAGRKRGTKVIDRKVIYIKDIYMSHQDSMAQNLKANVKKTMSEDKVLSPTSLSDSVLAHSSYTEKFTIPNRKRRMERKKEKELASVVGEKTLGPQTQVLTAEQSLAHNIDVITSELLDSAAVQEEDMIIIVQDPNTGEREVLTIKSFQQGASRLISPNDDIMKALENFQKTTHLDEVTEDDEKLRVKTEVVETSEVDMMIKTEVMETDCIVDLSNNPVSVMHADIADPTSAVDLQSFQPKTSGQSPVSHSHRDSLRDQMSTRTSQRTSAVGEMEQSIMPKSQITTSPAAKVNVVSMMMDDSTGKLVPSYSGQGHTTSYSGQGHTTSVPGIAQGSELMFVKSECFDSSDLTAVHANSDLTAVHADSDLTAVHTDSDLTAVHANSDLTAVTTDSDLTAVHALIQMKSTAQKMLASSSLRTFNTIGQRHQDVAQVHHSGMKEELGVVSDSGFHTSLPPAIVVDDRANDDDSDDQDYDAVDDDSDNQDYDAIDDDVSDAAMTPSTRQPRKRKALRDDDWSPRQTVRKSLRKNSYSGVAKIVASLCKRKKSKRKKPQPKCKLEKEDSTVNPSAVSTSECKNVRCNICREFVSELRIREHVNTIHGTHPYKCGLCAVSFIDAIDLQLHLCQHTKQDQMRTAVEALSNYIHEDHPQDRRRECGGNQSQLVHSTTRDVSHPGSDFVSGNIHRRTPSGGMGVAVVKKHVKCRKETGRRLSERLKAKLAGDEEYAVSPPEDSALAVEDEEITNLEAEEDDPVQVTNSRRSTKQAVCVCGLCKSSFVTVTMLRRHVIAHYREKPYSCEMCSKKFGRRDELVKHRHCHQECQDQNPRKIPTDVPKNKRGLYPCPSCDLEFEDFQEMYHHLRKCLSAQSGRKRSKGGNFNVSKATCNVCGLVVSGPRHLVRHKLVHSGERTWLCQECGRSFLRSHDLKAHLRRHKKKQEPDIEVTSEGTGFSRTCPFCEKTITSFKSLRNHLKTHKSDRLDGSYKCTECDKVFIKHISLRNHMQTHRDTYQRGLKRGMMKTEQSGPPFTCRVCQKLIRSKSNFIRHMKTHEEDKDHICSHCNKGFCRMSDLQIHERVHNGERPFQCNVCGRRFSSSSSLSNHLKLHSEDEVQEVREGPGVEPVTEGPGVEPVTEGPEVEAIINLSMVEAILNISKVECVIEGPGVEGVIEGPGVEGVIEGPGVEGVIEGPGVEGVIEGPGVEGVIESPGVEGVIEGPGVEGVIEGQVVGTVMEGADTVEVESEDIETTPRVDTGQEVEVVYFVC